MSVEHHDLHHEFPEMSEAIRELKMSNAHFAKLFEAYHDSTDDVEGLQGQGVPVADATMDEMKKQRVKLKDELYDMLVAHRGQ